MTPGGTTAPAGDAFDRFVHTGAELWFGTIARIEEALDRVGTGRRELRRMAETVRRLTAALDGAIEELTAPVCPRCRDVCCINRHGWPDENDLIVLAALGESPPPFVPDLDDEAPCRFLAASGCTVPRWRRPFRCNWYFCGPLVEAIGNLPGRKQRNFTEGFRRLVEARTRLIEAVRGPIGPGAR